MSDIVDKLLGSTPRVSVENDWVYIGTVVFVFVINKAVDGDYHPYYNSLRFKKCDLISSYSFLSTYERRPVVLLQKDSNIYIISTYDDNKGKK